MTNEPRQSTAGVDGEGRRWGALAYASYRRFWLASLVRVFGLQFRIFGAGWLVVAVLDRSPVWLGVVGLAQALPTIILSVPAGVLADRLDNQRLLVLSQTATTIVHFELAALVVAGMANIWLVIVWALVSGALTALGAPSQQAILPRLIEMREMPSAPIDVYVPGCPPRPEALMDAFVALQEKIMEERGAVGR